MKKVPAADVEARFGAYLSDSQQEPVVVMGNGKPVAVLMGIHDEEELERFVFASSRRLQEILEAGRQEIRDGQGIPAAKFWKQIGAESASKRRRRRKK